MNYEFNIRPRIFPPVYAIACALLMLFLDNYLPLVEFIFPPFNKLGFIFIGTGLGIDLWSLYLFFRHKTTFHPLKLEKTEALVTSGMYRISRNPMYLGLLFLLAGWAVILGSLSPFFMPLVFVYLINNVQIRHEEELLLRKFDQEYEEYKNKVRRWF